MALDVGQLVEEDVAEFLFGEAAREALGEDERGADDAQDQRRLDLCVLGEREGEWDAEEIAAVLGEGGGVGVCEQAALAEDGAQAQVAGEEEREDGDDAEEPEAGEDDAEGGEGWGGGDGWREGG